MMPTANEARVEPTFDQSPPAGAILLGWTVEERIGRPGRFSVRFADVAQRIWQWAAGRIGKSFEIELDDSEPFVGLVWGRRTHIDQKHGQTTILHGYDRSYLLHGPPQRRAFAPGSLEDVVTTIAQRVDLEPHVSIESPGRMGSSETSLVQFDESELGFLCQRAAQLGLPVCPWRGGLWFGDLPGQNQTLELDISSSGGMASDLVLVESHEHVSGAFCSPTLGAPFAGSPTLDQDLASPVDNSYTQTPPELLANGLHVLPLGLAATSDDGKSIAELIGRGEKQSCFTGSVVWRGAHKKAVPGALATILRDGTEIAGDLFVAGVTHRAEGDRRDTVIHFGAADLYGFEELPHRQAAGLVVARVLGEYDPARATCQVMPLGFSPDTEPLRARLLSAVAAPKLGSVHCPLVDSLACIGFEEGNPDAPVLLGVLHDRPASDQAGAETAQWVIAGEDGSEIHLGLAEGKLTVRLKGVDVAIETDMSVAAQTKAVEAKCSELKIETEGDASMKTGGAHAVEASGSSSVKASRIDLKASQVNVEKS